MSGPSSSALAEIPLELLQRLPKTDLHCHLDGSLRLATILELAREQGVVSKSTLAQRMDPLGEPMDAATVEVHLSNLRRKIGAERVRTVRGVGYQLLP